ncbi:ribosomal RNA small subunit methyltransferase A [candidate division KSB1 bacterium]|nr:ribosomal RNA small subunit methyltransferase A [candidate division KSB1 bacterium]
MKSIVRPVKKWGQNFLQDTSYAGRMIQTMEIQPDDCLLEIGPGEGALTQVLAASSASSIHIIEKDRRLIPWLQGRFGSDPRFHIHSQDILTTNFTDIVQNNQKLRVIGNLPYNITSPILFKLLDACHLIQDATVTIQKEVGERLASDPGCKAYGIPSIFFQIFAQVQSHFTIPPEAFFPIPKVESAVISIRFYDKPLAEIHDEAYFKKMVHTVFGQRRKMLRNTLKSFIPENMKPSDIPFDLQRRPETYTPVEMVALSNFLYQHDRQCFGQHS